MPNSRFSIGPGIYEPVENMGLHWQCVYSQGGHGNGIGD